MNTDINITITCMRAADDHELYSDEYQKELDCLRNAVEGRLASRPRLWPTPEGAGTKIVRIEVFKLEKGPAPATAVINALSQWLHSRDGRKLKIKIGDVEEVAHSMEDLKALFTKFDAYQMGE